MCNLKVFGISVVLSISTAAAQPSKAAETFAPEGSSRTGNNVESYQTGLWENGIGEGFRSTVQTFTLELGATQGHVMFGGSERHDLALLSVSYGRILGRTVGLDRFYRGNWELRGELFGGSEFSPTAEWLVGLAPHLRYNFATGTRIIPFLDAGAGVTATSIGPPDLSNTFEFNLQATAGVHWFISARLALTIDVRYLHMSCAGISHPNLGLNGMTGMIGLSLFF
jgi:hypothetical protein